MNGGNEGVTKCFPSDLASFSTYSIWEALLYTCLIVLCCQY